MRNRGSALPLFRQLASSCRGVVAIEFAVVGLVFITMTMFVMDLGLQLYTQSIMDDAARTAAHSIKTGNRTIASSTPIGMVRPAASDVRTTVCNLLSLAATSCTKSLQVYAANSTSFAALSSSRIDSSATGLAPPNSPPGYTPPYSVGGSNAYVLLQVALPRVSVIPFNGFVEPYVISTVMFENEL